MTGEEQTLPNQSATWCWPVTWQFGLYRGGVLKVQAGGMRCNFRWSHGVGECMNGPSVSLSFTGVTTKSFLTGMDNICFQCFSFFSLVWQKSERIREYSATLAKLFFLLSLPVIQFPLHPCANKALFYCFTLYLFFYYNIICLPAIKTLKARHQGNVKTLSVFSDLSNYML